MPMTYRIDPDRKRVLFTASGRLTDAEMIACIARLNADPQLKVGMSSLSDARSVTQMDVTAEGFKTLAELMNNSETERGASLAALLVTGGGNVMLAKLLVAFSESQQSMPRYKVFTDPEEAELWLGSKPLEARSA